MHASQIFGHALKDACAKNVSFYIVIIGMATQVSNDAYFSFKIFDTNENLISNSEKKTVLF